MKYWINTVNQDHVLAGKAGSFIQANHGRRRSLDRMAPGDMVIFYSPRRSFEDPSPLQQFTAIAQIGQGQAYRVHMTEDFNPFRRPARYLSCQEISIRPLIDSLDFITDKRHWGYKFRLGVFEIPDSDFDLIAEAMNLSSLQEGHQAEGG
jgi:hypothetical protein